MHNARFAIIDFLANKRRLLRSGEGIINELRAKSMLDIKSHTRSLNSVWCHPNSRQSCWQPNWKLPTSLPIRYITDRSAKRVSSIGSESRSRLLTETSLKLPDDANSVVSKSELVVYIKGMFTSVKSVDLYSLIRRCNVEEIFALVERSGLQLDKTHLALCLKRLFALSTRKQYGLLPTKTNNLRLDHRFQVLSMLLAKKARFLEPAVAVDMLTFLVHFGMETSDLAVKIYLHIVTKQVNNLSLDQMATLAHNLGQLGFSKQTEILSGAVKTLCNTRQYQLATLSVEHMIFLLTAFGADLVYADELLKMLWIDRFEISHLRTALGVFCAIGITCSNSTEAIVKPVRRHRKLEKWCIETVLKQLDKLDASEAKSLLFACKQLRLYNGELLYFIGQHFSSAVTSNQIEHLSIWLSLTDLGYFHGNLSVMILDSINDTTIQSLSAEECVSILRIAAENVSTNKNAKRVDEAKQSASDLATEKIVRFFSGSDFKSSGNDIFF